MIFRKFKIEDYEQVLMLLIKSGVEPPSEPSDFAGVCIVAEDNDRIVGCVWALVGLSSQAHVDYFAVDHNYRGGKVGFNLIKTIDAALLELGVKRYTFYIDSRNADVFERIEKVKDINQIKRLKDLRFYRREIQ